MSAVLQRKAAVASRGICCYTQYARGITTTTIAATTFDQILSNHKMCNIVTTTMTNKNDQRS